MACKYCAEYWLKELQESMDRCTGRCDITEILLKTASNLIQVNKQTNKATERGLFLSVWHNKRDCSQCTNTSLQFVSLKFCVQLLVFLSRLKI